MLFVSRYPRTLRPDLEKNWRASGGGVKKQESRLAWLPYHGKCLIETLPQGNKQPFWQQNLLSRDIEKFGFCIFESVSIGIVVFVGVEWMSKKMN